MIGWRLPRWITPENIFTERHLLDFGCVAGKHALEIAPSVKEVWGNDVSSEMIKAAKRNAAGSDFSNVRFLRADISDLRLNTEPSTSSWLSVSST